MITLLINRMPPTSIKRSYPSFLALQSVKGCGMTTLAVIYMACLNRNGRGTLQMRNWLACVLPHCGVMIVCLIDLAVVTGQRIGDLLALKWSDVSEEGVLFKPRKTAKSTGVIVPVKMTSQLQNILERARHFGNVKGITVIHTIKGHPYTYFGAQTAWKRAVARACTRYEEECKKRDMTLDTAFLRNMHFHDLRRKSLTDAKRQGKDPQKLAGHTDPKMTARYLENVEIEWVEPVQIAQIG